MQNKTKNFYIFSHNVEPNGISGGETILIETFKRIGKYFSSVIIYTWKPGKDLYVKYGLKNVTYRLSHLPVLQNFYLSFFIRTVYGFYLGCSLRLKDPKNSYLYFSSDFWPDAIPVVFLKFRYPQAKFISSFYLAAPNPFFGFDEQKKRLRMPTINGIFFYLMQKPIFWFSRKYADLVFVTSEPDINLFPKQKAKRNYFVVKGGVNVSNINKYKRENKNKAVKKYDAVFMGRFHPQKGVLELIEIWNLVVKRIGHAKLIMIGDGALMGEVKNKISKYSISSNIILAGYIFNTSERYKIFQQSKIVLHPAIYDSGGMSAAEAMGFGLPAVSFDLTALKTYYPKGMIKVRMGDIRKFADVIAELLKLKELYRKTRLDALDLIQKEWNWDMRAEQIAQKILET